MPYTSLEIVKLPGGEIALKRVGENSEPLLTIDFSEESVRIMDGAEMDVAKAMIHAAIETAMEMGLVEDPQADDSDELSDQGSNPVTLH